MVNNYLGEFMYCKNCGKSMDDLAEICINCGVKKGKGNKFCNNCGLNVNEDSEFCTNCGVKLSKSKDDSKELVKSTGGKSKILAGLLGIFFGAIGIQRFYLGYYGIGIAQIAVTILTCGAGSVWGFIEGILILCDTVITKDAKGNPLE